MAPLRSGGRRRVRPITGLDRKWTAGCRNGAFDPSVWTGRALQAECEQMEGVGLAHLYPALAWSVCAPGHHGYPRAPDLILRKALRGRLGHQITGTTARPFLHFLNPTRRPRRVSSRLVRRVLRSCVPAPTRSRRSVPTCWQGQ